MVCRISRKPPLLHAAVMNYMRGNLKFVAIQVWIDTGVELRGASAQLNLQRTREEEYSESGRPSGMSTPRREVRSGADECCCCERPPQDGPP